MSSNEFDIIIIGSGSGGGVAAHMLANQGKKVGLIDKGPFGGECSHYGCMPTKSLLESAKVYEIAKHAPAYGVRANSLTFNYPSIKARVEKVIRQSGFDDSVATFVHEGITTIRGRAHFIDEHTVSVADRRYKANTFIVATGSTPKTTEIPGLHHTGYITHREAVALEKLPKSIFIIGAGAIGAEYAEIFSTFGSRVHLCDASTRILSNEDHTASQLVQDMFENKGIRVHTSSEIIKVEGSKGRKTITYKENNTEHSVTVEEIMLTVGRKPNVDLGLSNAGVTYSPHSGIRVNKKLQTSSKHIYAIGDVTSKGMYTHVANYQARIAVYNILHKKRVAAEYHAIPRVTYLHTEVAAVGYGEEQLKSEGIAYQVGSASISVIARSITSGQNEGFVKVFASHTGVVLGASIVAPRAGEIIHELTLATQVGLKADKIANMVHAFPTWSEAVRVACAKIHCI